MNCDDTCCDVSLPLTREKLTMQVEAETSCLRRSHGGENDQLKNIKAVVTFSDKNQDDWRNWQTLKPETE